MAYSAVVLFKENQTRWSQNGRYVINNVITVDSESLISTVDSSIAVTIGVFRVVTLEIVPFTLQNKKDSLFFTLEYEYGFSIVTLFFL